MSDWVDLTALDAIPDGESRTFEAGSEWLAVCRVGSDVYVVEDLCPHDMGPLGDGKLDGGEIVCPRHGARFDVRTGEVLCFPALCGLRRFDVRVEGGRVLVDLASAKGPPETE